MGTLKLNRKQEILFEGSQDLVTIAGSKYAQKIAKKFSQGYKESLDEVKQEARRALNRAAKSFKPSHGAEFGAFAWKCVANACMDLLRQQKPQPSIDAPIEGGEETGYDPDEPFTLLNVFENTVARRDFYAQDGGEIEDDENFDRIDEVMTIVNSSLQPDERRAIEMRLTGTTIEGVAKELKVSKTAAHRILTKAVSKIKEKIRK